MDVRLAGPSPFELIQRFLPATLILDAAALLIAALICVVLGLFASFLPRAAAAVIDTLRPLSMALPAIVLGPLLIIAFVVRVHLFGITPEDGRFLDLHVLLLPALTLGVGALALTLGNVRAGAFAVARSGGAWAGVVVHLLGAILTGTFVVEALFNWPGIGLLAINAAYQEDYGVVRTVVLVMALFYLVIALPLALAANLLGPLLAKPATPAPAAAPRPTASAPAGRSGTRRVIGLTLGSIATPLVLAVVVVALFAPLLTHNSPTHIDITLTDAPPSPAHPLGTDMLGRDLLSRTLYGAQPALQIGVVAVLLGGVIGMGIGALLGLIPASVRALSATLDGLATALAGFPALALALVIVAPLEVSLRSDFLRFATLVLPFAILQVFVFVPLGGALIRWLIGGMGKPGLAGAGRSGPNPLGALLAQIPISIALVILAESALSFLGLGIQPPGADWGLMLGNTLPDLLVSPGEMLGPAIALGIAMLGLVGLGEAIRYVME